MDRAREHVPACQYRIKRGSDKSRDLGFRNDQAPDVVPLLIPIMLSTPLVAVKGDIRGESNAIRAETDILASE